MSQATKESLLSQAELKELLHYDPETGEFTWLVSNSNRVKVGDIAGCINKLDYRTIAINRKIYLAHRLAFLWMTEAFPENMVDHINHDKSDNRWENLRPATRAENKRNTWKQSNNTSGFKGVYFNKGVGKYVAHVTVNGAKKYLGCFTSPEEAYQARCCAEDEYYGEFANY